MKRIALSGKYGKDKFTLVDDDVFDWLNHWKWQVTTYGYATRATRKDGGRVTLSMHREVLKAPKDMQVDHKNMNKLDNRKENLRVCTHQQNQFNTLPHKRTSE